MGFLFKSEVAPKNIPLRYQHQVKQAIPLALSQGRLGWEVTDVNITLINLLATKKGDVIKVDICSKCHPFFTGKQKLVDTGGRVDKFNKRYGKAK